MYRVYELDTRYVEKNTELYPLVYWLDKLNQQVKHWCGEEIEYFINYIYVPNTGMRYALLVRKPGATQFLSDYTRVIDVAMRASIIYTAFEFIVSD